MTISRRAFAASMGGAALATAAFLGLRRYWDAAGDGRTWMGYGPLEPDPNGLVDLPKQFRYLVISRAGERMDDGFRVPASHDGMAAFPGPNGRTLLVRNHELSSDDLDASAFAPKGIQASGLDPGLVYDVRSGFGGTTTLVYDTRHQRLERHYLSLAGTLTNCAGGPTPWNTWVSCEETTQRADDAHAVDHGYNFEVPADAAGLTRPVPLRAMGRFKHEAIAVDAATGAVYQTEDRADGLFYRFVPDQPGNLRAGGRLQALKIEGMDGVDTSNHETRVIAPGGPLRTVWVDLDRVESPEDTLREEGAARGAARFCRGEGVWAENGRIYFACTGGGPAKCGQIWRYTAASGGLELFAESPGADALEKPDNIVLAPWGDLLVCEDGPEVNRVVAVTPAGRYYTLARNAMNDSEFAGGVFSPDGSTFFVNIQDPGLTLAITGPWNVGA